MKTRATRGVHDFRRVPKASGRAKYKLTEDTTLHLFAGVNESTIGLDVTNYTTRTNANVRSSYEMLRIEHQFSDTSQLQIQGFHNYAAGNSKDKELQVEERKSGAEFQHFFQHKGKTPYCLGGQITGTRKLIPPFLNPKMTMTTWWGAFSRTPSVSLTTWTLLPASSTKETLLPAVTGHPGAVSSTPLLLITTCGSPFHALTGLPLFLKIVQAVSETYLLLYLPYPLLL